jgi:hypothetical protein
LGHSPTSSHLRLMSVLMPIKDLPRAAADES